MKLVLADPTLFKDSINVISELVTEARLKIQKDAVELVAMDPANVSMVIFKLLSSAFTEYQVEQPTVVGINFASLKQILKRAQASDVLILELTTPSELKVVLKGSTTRTFSLALLDIDEKEQKVPNLTFPLRIQVPGEVLNNAIADADIVGESVSFVCEPQTFIVQAEGDLSKASIEVKEGHGISIQTEKDVKIRAKYSIEYLKKMIAGSKLSEDVVIQFNENYPLRLEYTVIDKLQLAFILAPRVEND